MGELVIICVDDEPTVLSSLEMELKGAVEGCVIETAQSGLEALELAQALKGDGMEIAAIVADYIMPEMKGDELLIKLHLEYPSAQTLLLTGQAQIEGVTNAINEAGLYRYISKPWEPADLRLTLEEAVRKYKAQHRIFVQGRMITDLNATIAEIGVNEETTGEESSTDKEASEEKLYAQELYDQLFFIRTYQGLSLDEKDWVAHAVIGLISCGPKVTASKVSFIEAIIKDDPQPERATKYIELVKAQNQPDLAILKCGKQKAYEILKALTWVIVASKRVREEEIEYYNYICRKLGYDESIGKEFLILIRMRIKANHTEFLLGNQISQVTPLYQMT